MPQPIVSTPKTKTPFLVTILAVLLIAAAVIIFVILKPWQTASEPSISTPNETTEVQLDDSGLNQLDSTKTEDISTARLAAFEYDLALIEKFVDDDSYTYDRAHADYAAKVAKLSGVAKLFFSFRFSGFICTYGNDLSEAIRTTKDVEPLATTDSLRLEYLMTLQSLYSASGKTVEADAYAREINRLTASNRTEGGG